MRRTVKSVLAIAVAVFAGAFALNAAAAPAAGDKCSSLMKNSALRALPNTTLTLSETVEGSFLPPGEKEAIPNLPSFCRVAATLKPGPRSDVKIEIWMPTSGWNGMLEGIGNSGLGGKVAYNNAEPNALDNASLADAVKAGYAGVSTDTGHVAKDRTWLTNEDKMRDYGYRAIHAMTVTAKAVIQQFYGSPAKEAYFNGCSTGGGQALGEAQRYPDDYNGILAGSPQNYLTHTRALDIWKYQIVANNPKAAITNKLLSVVTQQVLALCGKDVGAPMDGFLSNDPRECWYGPEQAECSGNEEGANPASGDPAPCLNAAQVDLVMKLYGGYWIPGTHIQVMPGFPKGSEGPAGPGNVGLASGAYLKRGSIANTAAGQFYARSVLGDPNADLSKIDIGKAVLLADKKFGYIDHISLDLSGFMQHGGKLLIYQGWNDPDVPIFNMIDYYSSMVDAMQREGHMTHAQALADAEKSARFFAVKGMGHCGGGPGPNYFDALGTLAQWVEHNVAPERIVATHVTKSGEKTFTRPLCPYPQQAFYSGKGDRKDAATWMCLSPEASRAKEGPKWNWELYDRFFYAPQLAPKMLMEEPGQKGE